MCSSDLGNLAEVGIQVELQTYEWVSYLGVWVQGLNAETTIANQSVMSRAPVPSHARARVACSSKVAWATVTASRCACNASSPARMSAGTTHAAANPRAASAASES